MKITNRRTNPIQASFPCAQVSHDGKPRKPIGSFAIAGLLLLLPAASVEALEYNFQSLQVQGAVTTIPQDVNNDGIVVGFYFDDDEVSHGFIWDDGTFSSPDIGLEDVLFTGINDAGVIIGTGDDFEDFSVPSFTLTDSGLDTFSYPEADLTFADGINNNGNIVGVFFGDFGFGPLQAFVKRGDVFASLTVPGFTEVFAADINDDGVIVGGAYDENDIGVGVLFRNGEAEIFNHPDGATELFAINNGGSIAGVVFSDEGVGRSFIFDGETFQDIAFPGAERTFIWGMNDHGIVVGSYILAGNEFGFVGVPIPEPTSLAILAVGLACASGGWRRPKGCISCLNMPSKKAVGRK